VESRAPISNIVKASAAGISSSLPASDGGAAAIAAEIGDLGNYYVSLDIDGLDRSIAPGTESPEADGLTFRQARTLLRALGKQGKLVGTGIVEVNPYLDHAELTQHIAVQLSIEVLASSV